MSRRTRIALLLITALSLSCAESKNFSARDRSATRHSDEMSYDAAPAPAASIAGVPARLASDSGGSGTDWRTIRDSAALSMIIRTGQAWIDVDTLASAVAAVHAMAARVGGFIANTTIQTGEGQRHTAGLEIKVPSANYELAMNGLTGIGELRSSTTSTEDVGEEYVDMSARMANARRLEDRLVTLLANRTGKLDDVLAVERELARVREEIERYEGRLRYLRTRTATSTINVTLSEPGPVVGEPGSNVLADAAVRAWQNFVMLVAGVISASGVLIPLGVVGGIVLWLWRRKRPRVIAAA